MPKQWQRNSFVILLAILFTSIGDSTPQDPRILFEKAAHDKRLGKTVDAERASRRGLRASLNAADATWHRRFQLLLADCLLEERAAPEVLSLLASPFPEPQLEVERQFELAYFEYRSEKYRDAVNLFDLAEHLGRPISSPIMAKLVMYRGAAHDKLHELDLAEIDYRDALSLSAENSVDRANALVNLGYVRLKRYHYDEARTAFEQAREIALKVDANMAYAVASANLGTTYFWLGNFDRALKLLSEAEALSARLGDHRYRMRSAILIGEVYAAKGDFDNATERYKRARLLAQPGDGDWLANALSDLFDVELRRGNLDAAAEYNRQALQLRQSSKDKTGVLIAAINTAYIQSAAGEDAVPAFEKLLPHVPELDPVSRWQFRAGLASSYRKVGRIPEANRFYEQSLDTIQNEISKLSQDETKFTYLAQLMSFYQDYVDFLVEQERPAKALEVASSVRARVLSEKLGKRSTGTAAVSQIARLRSAVRSSGTTIMFYWVAPKRSFLWTLGSRGLQQFELPPASEISRNVDRYAAVVQSLKDPLQNGGDSGKWLYDKLVGVAAGDIQESSNIILIPDGDLNRINFETLPVPGESIHYWIEDASIAVAPSLVMLDHGAPYRNARLLLIGDPSATAEFPRLPHVKEEINLVSSHFREKRVITASAAVPAAYETAKPEDYSIIHFAAHAVADQASPMDSAIVLSPGVDHYKLFARDIAGKTLHAELVTLSGCRSAGSAAYRGEGLTGLSWAFLSAGARNVIAGLWDVDDQATAQLMSRLYNELAAGKNPSQALRAAKLSMVHSSGVYRKAYYWAAFETFTRDLNPPQEHSFLSMR